MILCTAGLRDGWPDIVELLLNPSPLITALYVVFIIVVFILAIPQQDKEHTQG